MINKKKKTVVLSSLCALLLLTGCTSAEQKNYQEGESLLQQGQFEEAAGKFQQLGSYEDASLLLMYSRASEAAENGDYEAARSAFASLGSFRDAQAMLRYYDAREQEAAGRSALAAEDYGAAVRSMTGAAEIYSELPDVRDAALREADCLNAVYERGRSLLGSAQYSTAGDMFTALGSYQDSSELFSYCKACLLEADGAYLKAADLFSGIPSTLDASARADQNRDRIYQQALDLSAQGDPESAINLFGALGSYRDAAAQRNQATRQLVQDRLKRGDYEGALFQLDAAPDAMPLQAVDRSVPQRFAGFLDGFVDAYLHFSAGSMDSVSGYYGVLPYIEQGGALDKRFYQVLMIGSYSHNSYYIYYGSELLDVYLLDGDCYIAYIRASASVNQPVGPVEVTRTFRILVRDTAGGMYAETIDDCLYGQDQPPARPVITGPLPNNELPADEDGDGIIIVDVMKKGFNGTMIIVLDPSRVFVGGPGFYGGSGMILEDLARRYDALGGINGGGFIDEDGGGSGGLPEGLTIVDGQSYHWAGSGASAAFDTNNVLHVGYYSIESAAEAGIRDCVSFGPALIVDGSGEYGPYMESGINPRTAIGQREDGAVLMLCIDGRQIHSIGANFGDIRDVMLDFGAVNACSLDGGSSTVMYYNGEYLNSPSSASGTSRYLPNAFLIKK
ncbi:MAG: phosphodiester glycosidase family protein [Oscillospiraceae bacterium]|nr:phosphodiester glycosidase family protein [Oscillospiraceae bacterium]